MVVVVVVGGVGGGGGGGGWGGGKHDKAAPEYQGRILPPDKNPTAPKQETHS